VVKVTIAGEEHTIRTEAPPDHTRAVAAYVDAAIRTVQRSGSVVESHKAAILAALQITDHLFRMRDERTELARSLNALAADVRRWLPPAKRVGEAGEDVGEMA
jgi:cell division protein ZapA